MPKSATHIDDIFDRYARARAGIREPSDKLIQIEPSAPDNPNYLHLVFTQARARNKITRDLVSISKFTEVNVYTVPFNTTI